MHIVSHTMCPGPKNGICQVILLFIYIIILLSSVYGYEKKHVMLLTVDTGAKTNVVKFTLGWHLC